LLQDELRGLRYVILHSLRVFADGLARQTLDLRCQPGLLILGSADRLSLLLSGQHCLRLRLH
jgi:hypothetical protein